MSQHDPRRSRDQSFELTSASAHDASVPLMASDRESFKGRHRSISSDGHDARSPASDHPSRPASLDEIFQIQGRSLYEKKCMIVNREIERMGMGKYQWYVWGLCGLGYFIDLLWAQAFGLVLSSLQQEFGFDSESLPSPALLLGGDADSCRCSPETASGNISSSFNAGLTAGTLAPRQCEAAYSSGCI